MSLILKGFESDALVEQINKSPSRTLIHEVHYKHGLKVLSRDSDDKFLMCDPDTGFAVARVWTETGEGETVFNFRTPYYSKERGRNTADRETIHSKKLSTLMGTLKRQNVIPNLGQLINVHTEVWERGIGVMRESFGRVTKGNDLGVNEVHALLQRVLGESPDTKKHHLDLDICKQILDKYNKVDKIIEERDRETERFFCNDFWCVGADGNGHLVVGAVKRAPLANKTGYGSYDKYQIVKPFKRVRNLEEYESLKPIMLMLKVHMQDKTDYFVAYMIPQTSGFLSDLDMIVTFAHLIDSYHFVWAMTPCSNVQS